ncbi:ABC transporter substrate-binding protein [Vibrio sp. 99-8-1]|uniref:substrate-binding periplasmic protein n=1 Tax=Vibrio sp. 99-8-1 TaxID=2607602 RepID=UPI0014937D3E|nr:ABC transporter substrate-binding protein [Vibrio sp. 99-8-1]NOI68096.1 ABC transporter substrate-binding protein [Vibrio sp. 99-8-1]
MEKIVHLPILLLLLLSSKLLAEDTLTLFTYHNPPLVSVEDKKVVGGNSWHVVEQLLNKTSTPYKVAIKPAMRGMYSVAENRNTCVFPIDRTQDRESKYSWVGPIAIVQYALYSAANRSIPLTTLNDAKRYNIATYLGSSIGQYLRRKGFHVRLTGEMKQGLLMLQHRRVDFWVVDVNAANKLSQEMNIELGEPELVFFTSVNYMACHPEMAGQQLDKFDQALNEMYISGEIQHLLELNL